MELELAPVGTGQLRERALVARAGVLQQALVHAPIVPGESTDSFSVDGGVSKEQTAKFDAKEQAICPENPLQVALAYYEAWTSKDFDRAMSYIADDIVCEAPAGRIEGAEAYRAFMGPFVQILVRAELIAAFGDEDKALVCTTPRRLR